MIKKIEQHLQRDLKRIVSVSVLFIRIQLIKKME